MRAVFWDGVLNLWEVTLPPASNAGTELDYGHPAGVRELLGGAVKTTYGNP